jgi:hypothetical protein
MPRRPGRVKRRVLAMLGFACAWLRSRRLRDAFDPARSSWPPEGVGAKGAPTSRAARGLDTPAARRTKGLSGESTTVIARSEATKQSMRRLDCFASLAMTDLGLEVLVPAPCSTRRRRGRFSWTPLVPTPPQGHGDRAASKARRSRGTGATRSLLASEHGEDPPFDPAWPPWHAPAQERAIASP